MYSRRPMALQREDTPACRLCGATDPVAREMRGIYQYVQCQRCGLAFVRNAPPPAQLTEQYNQGISSKLAYYRMTEGVDYRSFSRLLARIESATPRGRIL